MTSFSFLKCTVNPLRKKWAKWWVGPKNCLRIFKLIKSVNGKESIPAVHSGPKHLSYGLIHLSHGDGGWVKLDASTDLSRLNGVARSQLPFCKSLRIHENEIACGHAKNCQPIREHQFEFVNSERGMPKNEGTKRATRRPSDIN